MLNMQHRTAMKTDDIILPEPARTDFDGGGARQDYYSADQVRALVLAERTRKGSFHAVFGHLEMTPDEVGNWLIQLQDRIAALEAANQPQSSATLTEPQHITITEPSPEDVAAVCEQLGWSHMDADELADMALLVAKVLERQKQRFIAAAVVPPPSFAR